MSRVEGERAEHRAVISGVGQSEIGRQVERSVDEVHSGHRRSVFRQAVKNARDQIVAVNVDGGDGDAVVPVKDRHGMMAAQPL